MNCEKVLDTRNFVRKVRAPMQTKTHNLITATPVAPAFAVCNDRAFMRAVMGAALN